MARAVIVEWLAKVGWKRESGRIADTGVLGGRLPLLPGGARGQHLQILRPRAKVVTASPDAIKEEVQVTRRHLRSLTAHYSTPARIAARVSSLTEIPAKSYTMRCARVFVTAIEPTNGIRNASGFFEYRAC